MKKFISIMLCALMLASLCACAQDPIVQPRTSEIPEESPATETAQAGSGYALVQLEVPVSWTWETLADDDDSSCVCALVLSPKDCPELEYTIAYNRELFGVCGTGLEEKDVSFGDSGLTGSAGYYDGKDYWSYIAFDNTAGSYSVTYAVAGGAETPDISAYNAQIEAMLCTATLGAEGAVTSGQAAEAAAKAGFEAKYGSFDYVTGWWSFGGKGESTTPVYVDTKLNVVEPDFCATEGTYTNSAAEAAVPGQDGDYALGDFPGAYAVVELGHDGSFVFGDYEGAYCVFGDTIRLKDTDTHTTLYFKLTDSGLEYIAAYSDLDSIEDGAVFEQTSIFAHTNSNCR